MFKRLFRIAFTLAGVIVGYGVYLLTNFLIKIGFIGSGYVMTSLQQLGTATFFVIIFGIIFFRITPSIRRQSKKVTSNIESDLQSYSTNETIAGIFGLIAGLIVAFLISQIYAQIRIPYVDMVLTVITYLFLGYLGVVIFTKKGVDVVSNITAARKGTVSKVKGKDNNATPKILDTSVIIDGRILEILNTGFIEGKIIIPEFVLGELQHIADSSDGLKRNRGRRGLDILKRIQTEHGIEMYNSTGEKALEEIPEVDIKLLKLAQMINGKVVTNDYNLNKVAVIKGVAVLNINELANTLKPAVLPGEDMPLFLVKEGKEKNQAVAYLDDGTMIVVEEGKHLIGQTIHATVTSVLQTSAGRMIFAKPSS
ncbi:MAG: PIN/TRAM domain-containing protein [Anaerovoracaceae bacterium]